MIPIYLSRVAEGTVQLKQKQQEKQMEKILEKTSLSKVQFAVSWKVNLRHIENISNSLPYAYNFSTITLDLKNFTEFSYII